MGSSNSRPIRSPRSCHRSIKRTISSLFSCGGSTSHPPLETGDDQAELLVNSAEHSDSIVDDFRIPTKDSDLTYSAETRFTSPEAETNVSSESNRSMSEDTSSEDDLNNIELCNQDKRLSRSKELVPHHQLNGSYRYADSASTSHQDRLLSDPVSTHENANVGVISGVDNATNKDVSQVCPEVVHRGNSSSQDPGDTLFDGSSVENHGSEGFSGIGSDSPMTFHSPSNNTVQEALPSDLGFLVSDGDQGERDRNVLHVDVVSISSNILSSNTAEISSREARRNSRRLFWDAFSRRGSRRHSDSRTFLFSTDDDIDDLGSHDRWLLDFGGDFFDDFGGDSRYFGSGTHSLNERRYHSRSEIRERLRGGVDGRDRRTSICPSGLHPDGTCSCESILIAEESSTRASISRIVMLAETLFEVLDEIHRQPLSISLSMVSLPAPESVVDSFPVKNHRKPDTTDGGDDIAQCYICLAEYEEGDKIRVLPCKHEYHMSCVDKWLKEIHGVCPLCRGDVREGFTEEGCVSNSEIPSS